jgi:hypothetical protein
MQQKIQQPVKIDTRIKSPGASSFGRLKAAL